MDSELVLERALRKEAAQQFRKQQVIAGMIDRVKELLGVNDGGSHA